MPSMTFVDKQTTVPTTWLQEVNDLVFGIQDSSNMGVGDALVAIKRAASGAYARTQHGANEDRWVSIRDFEVSPGVQAAPGTQDNTAAMEAAEAALAAMGGGFLIIPYPGEWRMNWVNTTTNIMLLGPGGRGEYDQNCIRPYNTASPAITWGDGSTEVRYCGMENCHVSGTDGTPGAVRTAVGNAPQAILVRGGAIDYQMIRCVVYNGIQNIAFVPTLNGASITGVVLSRCHLRSDLAGVSTARNLYLARYENSSTSPDLGYLTSCKFINTRVNGPKNTDNAGNPTTAAPSGAGLPGGYVLEAAMLGNVGITVEVCDSYWDCSDGAGVKLTGSSGIVCYDFQLDPGGNNRVILETDQLSLNVGRYVVGNLRHGGQLFKNGAGVTTPMPAEADTYSYKHLLTEPFVISPLRFSTSLAPFDTAGPYLDLASTRGPLQVYQGNLGLETAAGARGTWTVTETELTLSTAGTTTTSPTNLLPDNGEIKAVLWRITETIVGIANFSIGDPATAARFASAETGLAAGSTGVGTLQLDGTGAAGPRQPVGNNLRITCDATPSAGKIRVAVLSFVYRPPQS